MNGWIMFCFGWTFGLIMSVGILWSILELLNLSKGNKR